MSEMNNPAGVTDSELVEPALVKGDKRRNEMLETALEAWRMGRTKIGIGIFAFIVGLAIFGPFFAPYTPTEFVAPPFSAPSSEALLGSDYLGHDVLTRVLYGGRTVITLALAATVIGLVLGVTLGLITGYARRWVDETLMRLLDVVLAFPSIVLTLLFVSIVGPKLWLIVLMVGISHAPRIARVCRAATLEVAQRDFVRAAEATGVPKLKILFYEILPNTTSPLLVEFGLRLTYSIGLIAALSFLGFGLQPPAADWGLMINENRIGITVQPWPVFMPVLLIGILTIGTNLIADGLGRALIGIERDTSGT
jgi:peptide/nickel transport system permease protein